MEELAQRLSEAWAAGVVDAATATSVLQAVPGIRLLSIAVQGPGGIMTMFGNLAQCGSLDMTLLHPCNSAAGHVAHVACPVRFELLMPCSDACFPDLQHAAEEHGCQYCDCIPFVVDQGRQRLGPPCLSGCVTLGFADIEVLPHEDSALGKGALLSHYLGIYLPRQAWPVITPVHTYMLPPKGWEGDADFGICGYGEEDDCSSTTYDAPATPVSLPLTA